MRPPSLERGFFILLVSITTLAFLGLIRGFIMPLFWAVVLAIVFQPVQHWWLERTRGRPSVASLLTILTILFAVVLPLTVLGLALSREALLFYERIATGEIDPAAAIRWIEDLIPVASDRLGVLGVDLQQLREGFATVGVVASQWMAQQALAIGQDAVRITILSAVMLYVLFFFLRDGDRILEGVVGALPLGEEREQALLAKFASVSRATIGGALVVAAVQGGVGGLVFWMLGIPGPVFWGAIMTVLSFLPGVGASLVWGPAAIILAVTGSPVRALILVGVGALFIGLIDNVLRPVLIGRYTQMPDFLILISTLGGLAAFGLSGVVVGPVIAAFFLSVWEMFAREHEERKEGPAEVV